MMDAAVIERAEYPLPDQESKPLPRLGFLGVGWIGWHRLEAMARSGYIEVAGIADPVPAVAEEAARFASKAGVFSSLEQLLELDLDGVVIATPSALHAAQSTMALEHGLAVFCQKPLGRNARETWQVVSAAHAANRLLGVDFSYRFLDEIQRIRELVQDGELGEIFAADLVFHNAYGPDKPWFYDWQESGGGCVMDLGIHLLDLALWILDFPRVTEVSSRLYAQGRLLQGRRQTVEDYAVARLDLTNGAVVQLACSWKLSAGRDAVISGNFYGTKAGAAFHNRNGSFYDFVAERFQGTQRQIIASSPPDWGGRAAVHWAGQLSESARFDAEVQTVLEVAELLDAIYET